MQLVVRLGPLILADQVRIQTPRRTFLDWLLEATTALSCREYITFRSLGIEARAWSKVSCIPSRARDDAMSSLDALNVSLSTWSFAMDRFL